MPLRQPIPRVRRHQERLLTITRQEVHSHTPKCLNLLGQTPGLCDTHDDQEESESPVGWHPLSPAVAVVCACPAGALADRPLWQSCQAHDGGFRRSFPPFAAGLTAIAAAIAAAI